MSLVYFWKDKSVVVAGMVANEASKGMGPDEESFNVTVPVTQKVLYIATEHIWLIWTTFTQSAVVCSIRYGKSPLRIMGKKKNKTKQVALELNHKAV